MRKVVQDGRLFQSHGFIRIGVPILTHQVQKSLFVLWAGEGEPQFICRVVFNRIADLSNHPRVRNQAEGEELPDVVQISTVVLVFRQRDDLYEPVLLVKPIGFKIIVVRHGSSVTLGLGVAQWHQLQPNCRLLQNRKMPKPANPVIEDIQEQREAPQLCERTVSPKTAAEFLQIHVRSIMCSGRTYRRLPDAIRTEKETGKGGRVAYT